MLKVLDNKKNRPDPDELSFEINENVAGFDNALGTFISLFLALMIVIIVIIVGLYKYVRNKHNRQKSPRRKLRKIKKK